MERVELPLSQFTYAQKLDLLEKLWDDLTREEDAFDSPAWHKTVLQDRDAALAAGKVKVSSWDEARERIKRNVTCK